MATSGAFRPGADPRRKPGGRPAIPQDVKDALAAATLPAIKRLRELIDSEDENVALKACVAAINKSVPDAAVYTKDDIKEMLDERLGALSDARLEAALDDLASAQQ